MFLHSAMGDRPGLASLADEAAGGGKHNVAFMALFLLGRVDACVDLLVGAGR